MWMNTKMSKLGKQLKGIQVGLAKAVKGKKKAKK